MRSVVLNLPVGAGEPPPADDPEVRRLAAAAANMAEEDVALVVLRRRSLDARRRRRPSWVLRCEVFDRHERPPDLSLPPLIRPRHLARPAGDLQPIIIGMGPAGLFAALAFADCGVACTIIERGAAVERRNLHVRDLRTKGQLEPESNLCFGEGGAGTYSDGKLYTRSRSPRVREVYERLVALGISDRILVDAHPHVGTNRLIPMMSVLRQALQEAGHNLLFDARVTELVVRPQPGRPQVTGVRLADGRELMGGPVVLSAGHSARDTYTMLAGHGVAMEAKPLAIGARIEHPQELIDQVQLGALAGHPAIGAAEYFVSQKVATERGPRGVYSFCMCPGGFILPTPTVPGHLNVNGMSNAGRGGRFANAALVVQVGVDDLHLARPGDLDDHPLYGRHVAGGALVGLALQSALERRAFDAGGGGYVAPAQRLTEFVAGAPASDLPAKSSYRPGLKAADLRQVLPSALVGALARGAQQIERRQLRGYLSRDAVIMGVETTTSSPVRVLRDTDRRSVSHDGLWPCAEGAGYAGGIVSSAIDGLDTADAILRQHGFDLDEARR